MTPSQPSKPRVLVVDDIAANRYAFEAQRHFGIIDARLGKQKYMLGDTYTIVDMNVWGWARLMPNVLGEGAWDKFKNLKRLVDEVSARPAGGVSARIHIPLGTP